MDPSFQKMNIHNWHPPVQAQDTDSRTDAGVGSWEVQLIRRSLAPCVNFHPWPSGPTDLTILLSLLTQMFELVFPGGDLVVCSRDVFVVFL